MLPMCDVFRALTTDSAPAGDKHLLAGLHANLNVNKAFQSLAAAQEDHGTIVHFVYDLLIAFEYLFEPRLRYDEKARMQYITFRVSNTRVP